MAEQLDKDAALDEVVRILTEERNTLDADDAGMLYCIATGALGEQARIELANEYVVLEDGETILFNT